MIRVGNVWRINNALIEEGFTDDGRTGYLLVSYAATGPNDITHIEQLRLNVGNNTVVADSFGRRVSLSQIYPGMWADVEFSPAMTRSIPPQANAFRVVVRQNRQNQAPASRPVTRGQIVDVDTQNSFLITGNQNDVNHQIRFVVTDETVILGRNGNRISMQALRPGQWVRVTHADFMAMSIPPQTTAFRIQVL